MKTTTITPGPHTLSQQLANPIADGRKRNDWRFAPVFDVGTYFVERWEDEGVEFINVSRPGAHGWSLTISKRNIETHAALLDALTPDHSLAARLQFETKANGVSTSDVLLKLVACGAISEDAVKVAIEWQKKEDE